MLYEALVVGTLLAAAGPAALVILLYSSIGFSDDVYQRLSAKQMPNTATKPMGRFP